MKPIIDKDHCAAQPSICPPMKECPLKAITFIEDEQEPIGGRIEINYDVCDGCEKCVEICCGHCIEMR